MTWKDVIGEPSPPARPIGPAGHGSLGKPIRLVTNHFPVTIQNPNIEIFHYDVTIKNYLGNEKLPKRIKKIVFETMKQIFPRVFENYPLAFDGEKNAYSVGLIQQLKKSATYNVKVEEEGAVAAARPEVLPTQVAPPAPAGNRRKKKKGGAAAAAPPKEEIIPLKDRTEFSVTLKKVTSCSLVELLKSFKHTGEKKEIPQTPLQMLEVMFRHYRANKYFQVGRNSFFSMEPKFQPDVPLGGGKVGMAGFFASLRPAAWKDGSILLNIDKSHTALYKEQSVIDFMKETMDVRDNDLKSTMPQRFQKILKGHIRGLKIRVMHSNIKRTYRVNGVTPLGANVLKFTLEEQGKKTEISIEKYFLKQYNCALRFPHLNCLHVGNPDKKIYMPIEVCHIDKGQRVNKKLSDIETANFIRMTAVPPADRLARIKEMAAANRFNDDPMLKALTFTIADMPLQTTGRVLPEPELCMNQRKFFPRQGVWDIRDKVFNHPATLKKWIVINYDRRTNPKPFLNQLVSMGKQKKMAIEDPCEIFFGNAFQVQNEFQNFTKKYPDLQLIMCILAPGSGGLYSDIKRTGDLECNLISQCVLTKNVFKCDPSTISNILLKLNAKMGGENNTARASPKVLQFGEPVLIMGADVNHPPAGGDLSVPSLAAVVGSTNPDATTYAVEVRAQEHRKEVIEDLAEITQNLLRRYHKNTGFKPVRIIMYRDGVSESQFAEVLAKEMLKMRQGCTALSQNYKPAITFLCVQKRHHTRLFCADMNRDGVGRSKNVPPGTIVDRDITHPTEMNFYLCSHQGIQGTSRPTHYHVLWDDSDFTMDQLQNLTYQLCHVYSRCTRSVSIPCPAYYAHLAAFRAKVYVTSLLGSDTMSTVSGDTGTVEPSDQIKNLTRISKDSFLGDKLYYI